LHAQDHVGEGLQTHYTTTKTFESHFQRGGEEGDAEIVGSLNDISNF